MHTVQGPPDWHPAPAAVKEAASKAAKHAQARGTDLAKLAITEFVRCYPDACQPVEVQTPLIASWKQ